MIPLEKLLSYVCPTLFITKHDINLGFPGGSDSKECGRPGFDPWVGRILWRRAWQPTPVLLPGESPWTEESSKLQFMGSQS